MASLLLLRRRRRCIAVPARIKEAFSAFHEKWELSERHSIEDRAITKLLEFYGQEEQLEDEFFRLKEWHSLLNGRYTGELKKLWDNYIEHTAMHRMKLMKGRLVVSKSWSANCDVHGIPPGTMTRRVGAPPIFGQRQRSAAVT